MQETRNFSHSRGVIREREKRTNVLFQRAVVARNWTTSGGICRVSNPQIPQVRKRSPRPPKNFLFLGKQSAPNVGPFESKLVRISCRRPLIAHGVVAVVLASRFVRSQQRIGAAADCQDCPDQNRHLANEMRTSRNAVWNFGGEVVGGGGRHDPKTSVPSANPDGTPRREEMDRLCSQLSVRTGVVRGSAHKNNRTFPERGIRQARERAFRGACEPRPLIRSSAGSNLAASSAWPTAMLRLRVILPAGRLSVP